MSKPKEESRSTPEEARTEVELTEETADESDDIFNGNTLKIGNRIEVQRVPADAPDHEWDYYWMLYSKNGQQVATGVHPHKRLNDLKHTVNAIATYIKTARFLRIYE